MYDLEQEGFKTPFFFQLILGFWFFWESHISLIHFWISWHQYCLKTRNCWTASAEAVSGSGDVNRDTVVFLLTMELEMFPKSCCDVVSQTLPTLGHCLSTKELFLDVKKKIQVMQTRWQKTEFKSRKRLFHLCAVHHPAPQPTHDSPSTWDSCSSEAGQRG